MRKFKCICMFAVDVYFFVYACVKSRGVVHFTDITFAFTFSYWPEYFPPSPMYLCIWNRFQFPKQCFETRESVFIVYCSCYIILLLFYFSALLFAAATFKCFFVAFHPVFILACWKHQLEYFPFKTSFWITFA